MAWHGMYESDRGILAGVENAAKSYGSKCPLPAGGKSLPGRPTPVKLFGLKCLKRKGLLDGRGAHRQNARPHRFPVPW
jgi:hypothetical protein